MTYKSRCLQPQQLKTETNKKGRFLQELIHSGAEVPTSGSTIPHPVFDFGADPDPTVHFNVDPDTTFYFYKDPDPHMRIYSTAKLYLVSLLRKISGYKLMPELNSSSQTNRYAVKNKHKILIWIHVGIANVPSFNTNYDFNPRWGLINKVKNVQFGNVSYKQWVPVKSPQPQIHAPHFTEE